MGPKFQVHEVLPLSRIYALPAYSKTFRFTVASATCDKTGGTENSLGGLMLHGKVMINEQEIIDYQISNMGQGVIDSDSDIYGFYVRGRDIRGHPYSFGWEAEVGTHESSAPELVALCMTECIGRLRANRIWQ